jgi:hypothetical protein
MDTFPSGKIDDADIMRSESDVQAASRIVPPETFGGRGWLFGAPARSEMT